MKGFPVIALLAVFPAWAGLVLDGVPQTPFSSATYDAATNHAGQSFYRIQSLPAGAVGINPASVTIAPNYNDSLTLDYGGVSLYREFGDPRSLDFSWPSAAGRIVTEQSYQFPVFRFDLGEDWTDFEIKASTNNFDAAFSAGGSNMVYYYRSWTAEQPAYCPDTEARAYYTDDYSGDPRVWIPKAPDSSIAAQLASPSSVVCAVYFFPSRDCECSWMRRDNTNLVWSWMRVTDGEYEKRLDGAKTRWRPIRPDSWESGLTTP